MQLRSPNGSGIFRNGHASRFEYLHEATVAFAPSESNARFPPIADLATAWEKGVMSLLDLDIVFAALVALGVGFISKGPSRLKLGVCFLVAILAWALRAFAILNGDATIAGDYFNGLNIGTGAVELAAALAWTAFWCVLGTVAARAMRGRKAGAR